MPSKPKKPCAVKNCPELADAGHAYCTRHELEKGAEFDRKRPVRLYDTARWRTERRQFLNDNPYCIDCQSIGETVKATIVDHQIPHKNNETLFWDKSNWRPRCKRHHDIKTATEDGGGWHRRG